MFASLEIADHVVADRVGQLLRGEDEMHPHRALGCEGRDQLSVFFRQRRRRNFGRVVGILRQAGMGEAISGPADGTHQGRDRAKARRRARSVAPVDNGLAVGVAAVALGRHQLVEGVIKNDDLALHLLFA